MTDLTFDQWKEKQLLKFKSQIQNTRDLNKMEIENRLYKYKLKLDENGKKDFDYIQAHGFKAWIRFRSRLRHEKTC